MSAGADRPPIRFGLLGCADIARRRVLPALAAEPGARLVAVASRSAETAREVAGPYGAAAVAGYDRLLERSDVDAVYVPLPSGLHHEWVLTALRAGKHVLAEKPLTTDRERAAELVKEAERAGLVLRENFMFVHHGVHRRVRALLDSGEIGELRTASSTFTMPPRPPGDIRYSPELGGGALLDNGAYPVRTALLFLGLDLEVAGAALRHDPRYGVDVGGSALLRRPDGVTAQLTFGMEHLYVCDYTLLGSTGRISLDRAFTPPAWHRPVLRLERQDRVETRTEAADDQCANTLAAFLAAVRDGDDEAERRRIVRQAELIDDIRAAAA